MSINTVLRVGYASCGIAAGAKEIYEELEDRVETENKNVELKKVGCLGMCHNEPIVELIQNNRKTTYGNLTSDDVPLLLDDLGRKETKFTDKRIPSPEDYDYFDRQQKLVLQNSGVIDPEDISEYRARSGYKGLENALEIPQEDVIGEIKESNLRGRGGAGFPTGLKWQFTYDAPGSPKYIICNADEGDPGAFMDRSVLEGDPHRLLEGMAIGAYAMGAEEGYIYCRSEYPLALERLEIAIEQATEEGYLGQNILGTDFNLELHISRGAGAFVCGEETALLNSIEGERGMPDPRPPFPAQQGLFDQPTNINNVETWANVPWIMREGADVFKQIGTEASGGTKIFSLAGKIKRGGLVEVPIGTTLEELIFDVGGGIEDHKEFKAVQIGGPSGGCLPQEKLDTPIDYETLDEAGAIMGSGGMVVTDEDDCMVDLAKYFLNFTQEESCGKCTFCRVGTKRMLEILQRLTSGEATEEDLQRLRDLAPQVQRHSLCGLGQTAPNPVLTTLRYFEQEYQEHLEDNYCRSGTCRDLITYTITDDCIGCSTCSQECPVDAIDGSPGEQYHILQQDCIGCGTCKEVCPVDAVEVQ